MREYKSRKDSPINAESISPLDLLQAVEGIRWAVAPTLDLAEKAEKSQYFTPIATASFMASMLKMNGRQIRVLDPGAGIGTLCAAWVANVEAAPSSK